MSTTAALREGRIMMLTRDHHQAPPVLKSVLSRDPRRTGGRSSEVMTIRRWNRWLIW